MSPLRWADPRERYDPEADNPLPRPFLLGEKRRLPEATHSLQRPVVPHAGDYPGRQPYVPPKFITLPGGLDKYRHLKDPGTKLVVLTKEQVRMLRHYLIGIVPIIKQKLYMNRILGKDVRAGIYIQSYNKQGFTVFRRAGEAGQLGLTSIFPTRPSLHNQRDILRYATYLWQHDRAGYARLKDMFETWKAGIINQARRTYDDYAANYENARNEWLRKVRAQMRPWTKWAAPK